MLEVHRRVCKLCRVVYISTHSYMPGNSLRCFCGKRLAVYVSEDHWDYERIPLDRHRLLNPPRWEVKPQHAQTGSY